MIYQIEHTDTYAGEANYSWVTKHTVEAKNLDQAVRLAKKKLGMTGVKCDRLTFSDMASLKPRGVCQIIFITALYE